MLNIYDEPYCKYFEQRMEYAKDEFNLRNYLQVEPHFTEITAKSKRAQTNSSLVGWQAFTAMSARETAASINHTFLCNTQNLHI